MLDDRVILVTGGTGSFGRCFAAGVLARYRPRKLIVFSRDEFKQFEMSQAPGLRRHPCIRYVIGDVRDQEAVRRAFAGVDVVVHAAALKHVPTAEANPLEAIKTNILGAANVIDAALERGVGRVLALSTDKAACPVSLYGATKLCADKLFAAADRHDDHATRFSIVRYGNVAGSRGSVIPFFLKQRDHGMLPITDPRMTRFWITLPQVVEFTLSCLERMKGGEVFVPKIPSMRIVDLANAIAPGCAVEVVGRRPGERLHEVLISRDDACLTTEYEDRYVISPGLPRLRAGTEALVAGGVPCPDGFSYSSDGNRHWLSAEELQSLLEGLG
jgi:UDP-N-acetylglucosamine 4,6-dehydratase/5-epimerase